MKEKSSASGGCATCFYLQQDDVCCSAGGNVAKPPPTWKQCEARQQLAAKLIVDGAVARGVACAFPV